MSWGTNTQEKRTRGTRGKTDKMRFHKHIYCLELTPIGESVMVGDVILAQLLDSFVTNRIPPFVPLFVLERGRFRLKF